MPRTPLAFVLAAPHSGGGKTTASLALAVALGSLGYTVHGCKCGPDYVDPTFMSQACGHPCLNLDTWLMGEEGVRNVFQRQAKGADIVLIEGVMGLLDGRDPESLAGSTLDVARVLGLPVVLVVRARGLARSIAPLVDGFTRACAAESVRLAGVIATCTGSDSHRRVLQGSLEHNNLPPLLLSLQRNDDLALPSRQLGLVPAEEVSSFAATLQRLGEALPQKDVQAFVDYAGTGNGFTFASYNAHDMLHVIREACGVFRYNKPAWKKLMAQGMQSDFSWGRSADKYIEVYHSALGW